ncbi:MAG: hypothetical protein KIG66_04375, partial [Bacteroidaceae bacterium]|nr:hypothetical protein [Bacteroidaceae bacterium]
MRRLIYIAGIIVVALSIAACSTTSNLLEGETLYRGIKDLNYNTPQEKKDTDSQEGVITALADAYTKVEGLLTGDIQASQSLMSEEERRDSMKRASRMDLLASNEAKEEVEGVLSCAPNG